MKPPVRYTLNELQQAVLDVLAGQIVPTGDAAEARPAVPRDEIIERVRAVPGLDDVTGMSLGPCMAALKRRGLVQPYADDEWYITAQGLEYVDREEADEEADEPFTVEPPCSGCEAQRGEHHSPECPAVDAFTAGRIPAETGERPDDAAPGEAAGGEAAGGEAAGGMAYPDGAESVATCSDCSKVLSFEELNYYGYHCEACERRQHAELAKDRVERPISRGLDLLLSHADLTTRHDADLQGALFEVLKALATRARSTGGQLPPADPQRADLAQLADDCLALADQVAGSLIVPGRCPVEA